MTSARIRLYQPADRDTVRRLCCDTADRGEPVERFFQDRDVFADLLLRYYLDEEPAATWVAELDGRVVGYLTGCLDTRRYQQAMGQRIVPAAIAKGIGRGGLLHRQTWTLLRDGLVTWLRGGFRHEVPLARYPAHLHVNVQEGCRGGQVGRLLVERFCAQVRDAKLAGLHAAVRGDNSGGRAFFERLGFTPVSRHPTVLLTSEPHEVVVYGKTL